MTVSIEADFLIQQVFIFMVIFVRIGAMFMVMPGFDTKAIPARIRLLLALAVSYVLVPVLTPSFPVLPSSGLALGVMVLGELIIGLAIGLSARIFFAALQVAGTFIAFQSGLAFAQVFDPTQDSQSVVTGSFLSLLAVTLLFVTDMHHVLLEIMRHSYELFGPGAKPPVENFVSFGVDTMSKAFVVGIQMATPVAAAGFTMYVATGILAKLIPQVQIFFVVMPASILLGFVIMFMVLSAMMMWFMDGFEQQLSQLLG